jgi:hypothetical protein
LDKPLGNRLRSQLELVENLDELRHFSRTFQPLTLSMKKIWSFYEFRESELSVKVVVHGPAGAKRTTSTEVKSAASCPNQLTVPKSNNFQIVDSQSAVMTTKDFLIGCEEAVPVNATHASLPRFGENPNATEFSNYITLLQKLVDRASLEQSPKNEEECRSIIEREVRAEVHQFYDVDGSEDSEAVRLWSVTPSLHELFENGPRSFLLKRSEEAKLPMEDLVKAGLGEDQTSPDPTAEPALIISTKGLGQTITSKEDGMLADVEQQMEKSKARNLFGPTTNRLPGSSDDSGSGYHIPDLSQYGLFRWIHVPANNMSWVEKTLCTIDKEDALEQCKEAAKSAVAGTRDDSPVNNSTAETPISEPAVPASDFLESPITNPALSQLLKSAVAQEQMRKESTATATDLLAEAIQDPAQAVELLHASQSEVSRQPTQLSEMPAIVADIRERASMLKTATRLQKKVQDRKMKVNTGKFLEDLNKAALEARETPSLTAALLHPKFWNLAQFKPNHERPHGRFMMPGFHAFYPESKFTRDPGGEPYLYSAAETAQFVLYVSSMFLLSLLQQDIVSLLLMSHSSRTYIGTLWGA